jgi:osmotically-inducible protein OsmY
MRPILCCLALALACACSKSTDTYASGKSAPPATSTKTPPPPVATDTGTDPADIELAARIRKALVDDSRLSTLGKNVVVVVKVGDVTLRGKVPSAEERSHIYDLASAVSGVNSVDNQLEVQP